VPRAILLLSALVFAAMGLSFTAFTQPMARLVEIDLESEVARTDFAATYGGFELGFALFLALCATRPEQQLRRGVDWVRPGLVASGCALAGFAAVRLLGMLVSSSVSPLMLSVLIAEAAGSAVSFWAAGQAAPPRPR
jgi:hypothetical protein